MWKRWAFAGMPDCLFFSPSGRPELNKTNPFRRSQQLNSTGFDRETSYLEELLGSMVECRLDCTWQTFTDSCKSSLCCIHSVNTFSGCGGAFSITVEIQRYRLGSECTDASGGTTWAPHWGSPGWLLTSGPRGLWILGLLYIWVEEGWAQAHLWRKPGWHWHHCGLSATHGPWGDSTVSWKGKSFQFRGTRQPAAINRGTDLIHKKISQIYITLIIPDFKRKSRKHYLIGVYWLRWLNNF